MIQDGSLSGNTGTVAVYKTVIARSYLGCYKSTLPMSTESIESKFECNAIAKKAGATYFGRRNGKLLT